MIKTIIIFLITQIVFGQCVKGDCYDKKGKYIFKDKSWFEGEWNEGNFVSGKFFYKQSGDYAVGEFKDGLFVEGKYNFSNGNWQEGSFNESNLINGTSFYKQSGDYAVGEFKDGFLVEGKYNFSNGNWQEGSFNKSNLINGTSFYKYNSGLECLFIYKGGLVIKRTCNNQNQYNEDDIVSGPSSSIINLKKFDDQPDAYYINITINNKKIKFLFDTGCSSFTMNQTQWDELSKGLVFEDLKISGKSEAVGAEHNTKYYKIIEPIIIDRYSIKNLIVGVTQIRSLKNPDKDNLIGLGFFNKFSNVIWNMSEETIHLHF